MKYHNIPTLFDNQASLINGKNIGTDSVRYIQDAGQKTAGTTYIDKNTNELYVCVTTTNSVNNDSNFSKFNLKEAFNKLDNISTLYVTTEGTQLPYLNGKQSKATLYFYQSTPNLPLGANENEFKAPPGCIIIPISVNWKDNIHRNNLLIFDYESDGSYFTVKYYANTGHMSYLLVYLILSTI